MLRSTRPLLSSSTRAIASQNASTPSLRRLPFGTTTANRPARRATPPDKLPPLAEKTRHYATTKPPPTMPNKRDPEEEKKFGAQKLQADPSAVSTESSVRHAFEPADPNAAQPVSDGLAHDLDIVKDTFRLKTVPKESYVLGLAGTAPFFATSLSTLYLSWDLNTEWPSQSQFVNSILISHESARHWLGVLEPLQLGYGAVIISFLGAIHWGLEYAERGPGRDPARTRFRYGLGVLAPAVAWPTLLMPVEFALTGQFGAFVALYWADTAAARRGWAPAWYGTYRFVLTAVAGAAIALSLIGRAKIGDAKPRLSGLGEKFHAKEQGEEAYDEKWEKREAEEKEKIKKQQEEEEKKKKEEEKKQKEEEEKQKKEDAKKGKGKGKEDKGGEEKADKKNESKDGSEDQQKEGDDNKEGEKGGKQEEK
ncbi:hypothetical protein SLS62_002108 [Diatrype stigma]|uniref:Mitochondrial inner membrane protein 1 n=1 Tax=Diatrype stigma TaxID=117547 RepID=A0AAN9YR32_9PEZI